MRQVALTPLCSPTLNHGHCHVWDSCNIILYNQSFGVVGGFAGPGQRRVDVGVSQFEILPAVLLLLDRCLVAVFSLIHCCLVFVGVVVANKTVWTVLTNVI